MSKIIGKFGKKPIWKFKKKKTNLRNQSGKKKKKNQSTKQIWILKRKKNQSRLEPAHLPLRKLLVEHLKKIPTNLGKRIRKMPKNNTQSRFVTAHTHTLPLLLIGQTYTFVYVQVRHERKYLEIIFKKMLESPQNLIVKKRVYFFLFRKWRGEQFF